MKSIVLLLAVLLLFNGHAKATRGHEKANRGCWHSKTVRQKLTEHTCTKGIDKIKEYQKKKGFNEKPKTSWVGDGHNYKRGLYYSVVSKCVRYDSKEGKYFSAATTFCPYYTLNETECKQGKTHTPEDELGTFLTSLKKMCNENVILCPGKKPDDKGIDPINYFGHIQYDSEREKRKFPPEEVDEFNCTTEIMTRNPCNEYFSRDTCNGNSFASTASSSASTASSLSSIDVCRQIFLTLAIRYIFKI